MSNFIYFSILIYIFYMIFCFSLLVKHEMKEKQNFLFKKWISVLYLTVKCFLIGMFLDNTLNEFHFPWLIR